LRYGLLERFGGGYYFLSCRALIALGWDFFSAFRQLSSTYGERFLGRDRVATECLLRTHTGIHFSYKPLKYNTETPSLTKVYPMPRLDFHLLAVLLLFPNCSSRPIFDEGYYMGHEGGDCNPGALPGSEIPTTDLATLFGYDRNDDESNFYSDYRPRNQLAAPENITLDRPLADLEGICPLTPKAFARMQNDPSRLFQETKQPLQVRTLLPRKQVEPPATIDDLISGVCADVIIIWARGTCNTGNIGSALGRCFFTYLKGNLDYTVIG